MRHVVVYWEEERTIYRIPPWGLTLEEQNEWIERMKERGWKEAGGFRTRRIKKTIKVTRKRRLKLNPNEDPEMKVKEWEKQTGRKVVNYVIQG